MGSNESKSQPQPIPRKELLKNKWRTDVSFGDPSKLESSKESIAKQVPGFQGESVPRYRLLVVGQIGAGKSSFFNSIHAIYRGCFVDQADVGERATSLTQGFRVYEVKRRYDSDPLPFLICDTQGFDKVSKFPTVHSLMKLAEGNIPDHVMKFIDPDDQHYLHNPSLKDRYHCVAFVIDAQTLVIDPDQPDYYLVKLKELQEELVHGRGIPLVILVTKIDKASTHVEEQLSNVYKCEKIRDTVKDLSTFFDGLPQRRIFPIKNYESEGKPTDGDVNTLLLTALKDMLSLSQGYLETVVKNRATTLRGPSESSSF